MHYIALISTRTRHFSSEHKQHRVRANQEIHVLVGIEGGVVDGVEGGAFGGRRRRIGGGGHGRIGGVEAREQISHSLGLVIQWNVDGRHFCFLFRCSELISIGDFDSDGLRKRRRRALGGSGRERCGGVGKTFELWSVGRWKTG